MARLDVIFSILQFNAPLYPVPSLLASRETAPLCAGPAGRGGDTVQETPNENKKDSKLA